ncbi:MAG: hypothetical protein HRU28_09710 [Rhizobiales bacterium]|nr:hypothetical protein [Hyphomicrobiales bacterium]
MNWRNITNRGSSYSLGHLKNFTFQFIQQAIKGKPERSYDIDVAFSWHCYTRAPSEADTNVLHQGREVRCFCPERYKYSLLLPDIIQTLGEHYCKQTGKGNYFIVKVIDVENIKNNYEIYFQLKKQKKSKNLQLFVQSAYVRNIPDPYRNKKKKIRFAILVHNVKHGKQIRT